MNRRTKLLPPKEHEKDEQQERAAERAKRWSSRWPRGPKTEDQPEKHQYPIKKGKAHKRVSVVVVVTVSLFTPE